MDLGWSGASQTQYQMRSSDQSKKSLTTNYFKNEEFDLKIHV